MFDMLLDEVGEYAIVVSTGDDLGSQVAPILETRIYRKYIKPVQKKLYEFIHKKTSAKLFLHSCGYIVPIIDDLIEIGVDILNPVQINVKNMDPKELKEEYGDDITFWGGGADTRNVINRKNPKEVEKHVQELLEIFSPGGGFVWSTIHNILPDVPPQNIVAMFDAIRKYHEYNI